MKRILTALLLLGSVAPAGSALAISAAAPTVSRQTKVTWGRISRIEYPHDGSDLTRVFVQTPSGEREFDVAESVALRDGAANPVGLASALRPGQDVRVYFNLGPNGEALPLEFTLEPPGPPGP